MEGTNPDPETVPETATPDQVPVAREGNFVRFVPSGFVIRPLALDGTVRFDILLHRVERRETWRLAALAPDAPAEALPNALPNALPEPERPEVREVAAIELSRERILALRQAIDRALGDAVPLIDHAGRAGETRQRDLVEQVEQIGRRLADRLDALARDSGAEREQLAARLAAQDEGITAARADLAALRHVMPDDLGQRLGREIGQDMDRSLGQSLGRTVGEMVADGNRAAAARAETEAGALRGTLDAVPAALSEKLLPALDERLARASADLAAPTAAIARETLDRLDLLHASVERMRRSTTSVRRDAILAGAIVVAIAALAFAVAAAGFLPRGLAH